MSAELTPFIRPGLTPRPSPPGRPSASRCGTRARVGRLGRRPPPLVAATNRTLDAEKLTVYHVALEPSAWRTPRSFRNRVLSEISSNAPVSPWFEPRGRLRPGLASATSLPLRCRTRPATEIPNAALADVLRLRA